MEYVDDVGSPNEVCQIDRASEQQDPSERQAPGGVPTAQHTTFALERTGDHLCVCVWGMCV